MRRVAALPPLVLAALLLPAATTAATARTIRIDRAVPRDCASASPGAAGTAGTRVRPARAGVATVRLHGPAGGDWDLAALDARGRKVAASTSFGARERLIAWTSPGRPLRLRICRRSGDGPVARLRIHVDPVPARAAARTPVALARVTLTGPADARRLARSGLDLTHDARIPSATVLLAGPRDRARLRATGLTWRVVTRDV